jgi:hypothetical protein
MSRVTEVLDVDGKRFLRLNFRAATPGTKVAAEYPVVLCPQCGRPSIHKESATGDRYIHTAVVSHARGRNRRPSMSVRESCKVKHGHVGDYALRNDT